MIGYGGFALFLILVGPAILLAIWAQFRVKSAYARGSQIRAMSGLSGAQAARELLDLHGLNEVGIEETHGTLSDHYDPRHKVLRLSSDVYHGNSLAALGIATHEAGHALQDAQKYAPLVLRNGLVPMAATGSWLSSLLIMGGFVMLMFGTIGGSVAYFIILAGIGAFAVTVVFQLINLPVEFDASRRAKLALVKYGMVAEQEMKPVSDVLGAAAMTYVAATLIAVMQLVYFLLRFGVIGGRD